MTRSRLRRRAGRCGTALAAVVLAIGLSGCSTSSETTGGILGQSRATAPGSVDAAAAARIISDYRARHGLPPVTVDATLTRIATDHAKRMASADRLEHVLPGEGSFSRRISAGGYAAAIAAENIGAGYRDLNSAMAGWEKSPAHNENLLRRSVSEIGIAVFNVPNGKFKTYWSLVLASPYDGPTATPGFGIAPFGIFGGR